jgi:hypothetical protein
VAPKKLVIPIGYAALVLLLYREIFAGAWFGWDCIETYWPDLVHIQRTVASGHWPLWNPFDRGGYAFHADPQPGLLYPVTWLAVAVGWIAGSVPPWVIELKALLHHVLAGTLLHIYLRSRRLPVGAAIAGAVAWTVSLPLIIHKASNVEWPLVWIPLVWLGTDRLIERAAEPGWWRRAAALAAVVGCAGSAGSPPGMFYMLVAGAAYGLFRLVPALRAGVWPQVRGLVVASLLGAALLAVVIVPGLAFSEASPRAVRTLAYQLGGALPGGATLVGIVAPGLGKIDAYLGVGVLLAVVAALALRPRVDRGAPIFFAAFGAVCLLLAFGGQTPLLPFLVKHVPGFGYFREANRYKLLFALAFATAAGHGVGALASVATRRAALTLAPPLVVLVALQLVLPRVDGGAPASTLRMVGFAIAAAGLLAATTRWPVARLALALLGAVDVAQIGSGFVANTERPPDHLEDRRWLAGLADVTRDWRIFDEYVMEQRAGTRLGVRDFRGYPAGDPLEDARYQEVLRRASRNPELLEAFNVRYVLHGPHHRNGLTKNYLAAAPGPPHWRALDRQRFEALHPVPAVAWYGAVRVAPDLGRAVDALLASEAQDGTRGYAVVEGAGGVGRLAEAAPRPAVAGRIVDYGVNRVAAEIDAPADGVVVVNEAAFPGWRVSVDGVRAEPLRVNVLLRGVVVAPGRHAVVWDYAPTTSLALYGVWGAAALVLMGAAARRRRSVRDGEAPT